MFPATLASEAITVDVEKAKFINLEPSKRVRFKWTDYPQISNLVNFVQ